MSSCLYFYTWRGLADLYLWYSKNPVRAPDLQIQANLLHTNSMSIDRSGLCRHITEMSNRRNRVQPSRPRVALNSKFSEIHLKIRNDSTALITRIIYLQKKQREEWGIKHVVTLAITFLRPDKNKKHLRRALISNMCSYLHAQKQQTVCLSGNRTGLLISLRQSLTDDFISILTFTTYRLLLLMRLLYIQLAQFATSLPYNTSADGFFPVPLSKLIFATDTTQTSFFFCLWQISLKPLTQLAWQCIHASRCAQDVNKGSRTGCSGFLKYHCGQGQRSRYPTGLDNHRKNDDGNNHYCTVW